MSRIATDDAESGPPLRWGANFDEALGDLRRSLPPSIPALSPTERAELAAILPPTRWQAYQVEGTDTWRLCPNTCDRTDPLRLHSPACETHTCQADAVAALWKRVDSAGDPA